MSDVAPSGRDPYAAAAGMFELVAAPYRSASLAALDALPPRLRPDAGPILDVGAGAGFAVVTLLERLPAAQVLALEPSPAMRSLVLARLAAHPEWFPRVTVRPEDFFAATLPPRLGGAILQGVLGHFDAGERAAALAELATRLPVGGAALLDLQAPHRPRRVPAQETTVATLGELTYRTITEAWPLDTERMRWRTTYLTLEGERVILEDTVELVVHHPTPALVGAEAAAVGLRMDRLGEQAGWLLVREERAGRRHRS